MGSSSAMRVEQALDLKPYNSYRIAGTAAQAYFPRNVDDLDAIFRTHGPSAPILLGGGNNVILCQRHYTRPFVIIGSEFAQVRVVDDHFIRAEAGASLRDLALLALRHGLGGLETFYDIPGTLGGALRMNAGAYGEDILTRLQEVELFHRATRTRSVRRGAEVQAGYRKSDLQDPDLVITSATLALEARPREDIERKMVEIEALRTRRFPKEHPNAGSVFKRPPEGLTVGEMVERMGLKGQRSGGAEISMKHGGFIVNVAECTGDQILALAGQIAEKVRATFAVELEMEQIVVSDTKEGAGR